MSVLPVQINWINNAVQGEEAPIIKINLGLKHIKTLEQHAAAPRNSHPRNANRI